MGHPALDATVAQLELVVVGHQRRVRLPASPAILSVSGAGLRHGAITLGIGVVWRVQSAKRVLRRTTEQQDGFFGILARCTPHARRRVGQSYPTSVR